MTQEVLIPKMRRLDKRHREIKIPFINLVLIFCSILFLIATTFVNLNIKHYIIPIDLFTNKALCSDNFIYSFWIVPQIPAVMMICSVLGKRMAVTTVILYILAGLLFLPIFGLGGGLTYLSEFGFGYILGYIPAVVFAGNILYQKYSFPNMIKASILGVLIIHLIGIFYMLIIALFKHADSSFISGWIAAQSGLKVLYDIIISFLAIMIGKYFHEFLNFILD